MSVKDKIERLRASLPEGVTLVAVSKTQPPEAIMEAYDAGQRIFGENRPQEMKVKHEVLPADIRWHLVGQLQTNKVKYIAPFVELIHSVDSDKLLSMIDKEAAKNNRTIDILLEVHIAREQTKSGWDAGSLRTYLAGGVWRRYGNVRIRGLMSIATNTSDTEIIEEEFTLLKALFEELRQAYFDPQSGMFAPQESTGPLQSGDTSSQFDILSAGMTSDYPLAIECGSNMVRIGSLIFGER